MDAFSSFIRAGIERSMMGRNRGVKMNARSGLVILLIVLAFVSVAGYIAKEQRDSFLHEGGASVRAQPWESNVHIFPGGDTLHLSLKGKTEWKKNDLVIRLAPGEAVAVSATFDLRREPGWIGEKDFRSFHARIAVSDSGNTANITVTNSKNGMDVWLVAAKDVFNGTAENNSVAGDFRGEIVIAPQ